VLALDFWNGNSIQLRAFIDLTGITFPALRNAGALYPSPYDIPYDNYILVDSEGIVRYTSVGEVFGTFGRFNNAHLRSAILQYLPNPVSGQTWSAVKTLFRD
jgi:hypothetical protein